MFITKEKDEKLRKGKLKRNDLILTTRGSVGNIAFYDDTAPTTTYPSATIYQEYITEYTRQQPIKINEYAKYNLELLNKYLPIFNGQKIVKIAVDDLTKDNSHLIKFFPNCDTQIVQNNKETRESEYFIDSIKVD